MRIVLLSPYDGGSHAAWARGWRRHSRHGIEIQSLPARFWKWRMHGAAITLARRFLAAPEVDRIVATDMLDLSTFLALTRRSTAAVPTLLYMHENQLTYPLPDDPQQGAMRRQHGERDRHYGFINLASMLAADAVAFNSTHHREELLGALPGFLRHFPEHRELAAVEAIADRSFVLTPGIETGDLVAPTTPRASPPLIVWNQRWEYDKNPGALFAALDRLARDGVPFRVALCGQQYGRRPVEIDRGVAALGDRVVHAGFLERTDYVRLLGEAAVVVSTARHEFFGIAVLEAIASGALPLLPRRLAYPELIPERFHGRVLYDHDDELTGRLRGLLEEPAAREVAAELASMVRGAHAWERRVEDYDRTIAGISSPARPECAAPAPDR